MLPMPNYDYSKCRCTQQYAKKKSNHRRKSGPIYAVMMQRHLGGGETKGKIQLNSLFEYHLKIN